MAVSRIDVLATPKTLPPLHVEDLQSVYWSGKFTKDWSKQEQNTKFCVSERLSQLVKHKEHHKDWVADKSTPIWPVSKTAMKAQASPHVEGLAAPKKPHADFKPPKSVFTTVTPAAKNARCNEHIEKLATPKEYKDLPIKPDSAWDYSEWKSDLPASALKYNATDKITSLSMPKEAHKDYHDPKDPMWKVSAGAKKALPSMRVQQLARPKSRSSYKEDYDANWYKVTPGAKNARPTPRLEELSAPLPRKTRQKKVQVS